MSAQQQSAVALFEMTDWYAVYLQISERDHQWRIHALYGDAVRPPGHTPFHPLPLSEFAVRYEAALQAVGGQAAFVNQMLRRAYYYGVDVIEAAKRQQAA